MIYTLLQRNKTEMKEVLTLSLKKSNFFSSSYFCMYLFGMPNLHITLLLYQQQAQFSMMKLAFTSIHDPIEIYCLVAAMTFIIKNNLKLNIYKLIPL